MQKQKITTHFLVLHSDYDSVFCALFQNNTCLGSIVEPKITASKNLMVRIVSILETHALLWTDLAFIAVNQGPSPFTTLRTVITTVNGILCAKRIPLVGVDGLRSFVMSYNNPPHGLVVALLNAFNKDIYFAIKHPHGAIETGWDFYGTFLQKLHTAHATHSITFIGNAVSMYQEQILNFFPSALIPTPLPATTSLEAVATHALTQWHEGHFSLKPLLPLYLKTFQYTPST